jgi:PIN domain nuclease of toxin-antitoxin system
MASYLLDTHTFIWFTENDSQLSETARQHIINIENPCYLSVASIWEIVIKQSINKLGFSKTPAAIEQLCTGSNISLLDIKLEHLSALQNLPKIHSDPFDRLIVAQAVSKDLKIITRDRSISQYAVATIW